MNCAVRSNGHRSYLVAGQESHCQLYHVNMSVVRDDGDGIETIRPLHQQQSRKGSMADETSTRNRRSSRLLSSASAPLPSNNQNSDTTNRSETRIKFDIRPGDLTQTDFIGQEPLQRVVRISPNCKLMATGGTDAVIRVWSFPSMNKQFELNIHTKEVDDIDFSPNNKLLVSIAKDGLAVVWNLETRKELSRLKWTTPDNVKYLFKRCRFGIYEGRKGQHRLYTITNPLGKVGQQVSRFDVIVMTFIYYLFLNRRDFYNNGIQKVVH